MIVPLRCKMMLLLGLGTAVLGARSVAVHAGEADNPVSGEAFVAWARENAVPFDTMDWRKVDLSKLSVLDEAIKGKRIVYLGEPDHFIHEKNDYRLLFIRYLYQKGFRHIGMEMGVSDGLRMDQHLATGEVAHLDRVAIFGFHGDQRDDREDGIPNITGGRQSELMKKAIGEARWFHGQLRELSESRPKGTPRLHWFGFDLSFLPGGGYVDMRNLLSAHAAHPLISEFNKRAARVPHESREEEAVRLLQTVALFEKNKAGFEALIGEKGFRQLRRSARTMAEGFRFMETGRTTSHFSERLDAMRVREEAMFRRMDEILVELGPDEKVILLGHNGHLSKDSDTLTVFGYDMWPSIGTHLAKKLPDEVFAIWMLYDHGHHGNPEAEVSVEPVKTRSSTVEHLLAQVGPRFLLLLQGDDPRRGWLDDPRDYVVNGAHGRGILSRQADAFFFVEEVTACQLR